jgi:hypothetical protein
VLIRDQVCSWSKLPILISSSAPYHLLSSAILARLVLTPKIIGILTPSPLSIQPLLSQAGGEDLRLFSTSLWAPTIPSTMEEGVVSPLVNLAPRLAVDSRAKGACRRVQDALGKARAMEEEGGVVDLKVGEPFSQLFRGFGSASPSHATLSAALVLGARGSGGLIRS